jgi:hypothetical protein
VYVCVYVYFETIKADAFYRQFGQYAHLDQDASVTKLGSGLHDRQKPRGSLVPGWQGVKDTLSQNYFRKHNLQISGLA